MTSPVLDFRGVVVFLARLERLLDTITHPFDVACVGFGPYLSTERKPAEAEPFMC